MATRTGTGTARTEEEITTILMALVAWAGQVSPAANYLKAEKGIAIAPATLTDWKVRYGERLDDMRDKYAGQLEGNLAHEMRDVARLAVDVERLALERAKSRLEAGKDDDPGKTAANVARVKQVNVDKLMTLTGRPKEYTAVDGRSLEEKLRKLVAMGVLQAPDEPKELEGALVEEPNA